ncbi:Exopolyphosphatase [Methanosarcinaceae archaeon Ag5]|uniref:Exopolyphosphatase n=1 Tax=Methanolapillus africanus TaxID=3028297 RepID=A0AAE4MJ29_9EURY|nr:Exopolyphosphatase [Methanosarcinaceae archaeon Ag5]
MLFATIDIGSNAVRLLLTNVEVVEDNVLFERLTLLRVPIRLGDDAFVRGKISDEKVKTLVKTMCGFKEIISGFNVMDTMACATSALREAKNGDDIVRKIKKESGIDLKVIDGKREAKLIYANHIEKNFDPAKNYLYIDVGGGSTEITFVGGGVRKSKSFDVGAIRLKEGLVLKETWEEMDKWLSKNIPMENVTGIGSGGNISSLYLLAKKINNDPLRYDELKELCQTIGQHTYEERITELGLKPDRADVILPACRIYLSIMKTCNIQTMHAPIIGLSDGMVHELYQKHKKKFME